MKKAAKTRSHTYSHTHTHNIYTLLHTHTHNCSAALRHFDWSSTRCVLKILLCNYPLPLTRLPPLTCHLPPHPSSFSSSPPLSPSACCFAFSLLVCVLRQNFIRANNLLTSFLSVRLFTKGGTLQANEACYTTTYIPFIYALHGTETDSTGARHALPLRSHFVAIR